MSKFKVGDSVTIDSLGSAYDGMKGVIEECDADNGLPYRVGNISRNPAEKKHHTFFAKRELTLTPKVSKFKIGDVVTIKNGNGNHEVVAQIDKNNPALVRLYWSAKWYDQEFLEPVRPPIRQGGLTTTYDFNDHTIQLVYRGPGDHEEVEAWVTLWDNDNWTGTRGLQVEFTFTPENCTGKCKPTCNNDACGSMNCEDGAKIVFIFCQALTVWITSKKEMDLTEAMKTYYDIHKVAVICDEQ
jgi:uncharacterized protein YodC (DUF2158 family)